MKKLTKIFLILLLIPVIIVFIISAPWLLMLGVSIFESNPPEPEITYGEFPFRLEYSVDNEIFVIEDVLVCEYDGVDWDEGNGKHRAWKEYFKNTGEDDLLILTDGDTKLYWSIGKAEYYMDDLKYTVREPFTPSVYYIEEYDDISVSGGAEELLNKYKIELIDCQLSKPIENKFE